MSFTLIGLAGRARVGKDTVAEFLIREHGFRRYAFAQPIKEAARAIFGLTEARAFGDVGKETLIPEWGMSPREMFQTIGTEFGRRMIAPDIWIRRAKVEVELARQSGAPGLVITDIRFENEAGGMVWHIRRQPAPVVRGHISENGVGCLSDVDTVIDNDGSLDGLRGRVCAALGLTVSCFGRSANAHLR